MASNNWSYRLTKRGAENSSPVSEATTDSVSGYVTEMANDTPNVCFSTISRVEQS